jgi:hypothetical protein
MMDIVDVILNPKQRDPCIGNWLDGPSDHMHEHHREAKAED